MVDVHARLIRHLEQVANLNREIEFLPDDEAIAERKQAHRGLLAPELAVVMAYQKIHLYSQLLESDLPEDNYLSHDLRRYFPAPLPERYEEQMYEHRLRREIIATVVANQLVDRAGTTFAFRLAEETGAPTSMLARAYAVAREVFEMRPFWESVEALDNEIDAHKQLEMLIDGRRLVERGSRWLVRAKREEIDIEETIERFRPGAEKLARALPHVLDGEDRQTFEKRENELRQANVSKELARKIAGMPFLPSVFDIVEVAGATDRELDDVIALYFRVGARLELNWLRDRIVELPRDNRWQALTRAALRDDLYRVHRALTQQVLEATDGGADGDDAIDHWAEGNEPALNRCLAMISDIKASRVYDTTTLPVALREVRNLVAGR
jgi:glutamate dehydrogenase